MDTGNIKSNGSVESKSLELAPAQNGTSVTIGGSAASDTGYISTFGACILSSGATLSNAGSWTATNTSASILEVKSNGTTVIQNGTSLTVDTQFSPTMLLTVASDGDTSISGDLDVTGALSKGSGTFTIDHPLDPENKLLQHSFVESPEMRNMYYGQATLENGKATIELPNWWHELNGNDKTEYSYQLTCIGGYTEIWVSSEVENGQFEISGNADIKVSWTLSAIRHDAFAEANRVQVELDKDESDIGTYRHAITDEQKSVNKAKKDKIEKDSK